MKSIAHVTSLCITLMLALSFTHAAVPRPAFYPSTPSISKATEEYTLADVLGVLSTIFDQLPANHPYMVEKKYKDWFNKKWPGAKDPTKIDELIQGILDAASVHLPYTNPKDDSKKTSITWKNVSFMMNQVMDLKDPVKVDTLLRILAAQTDVIKKTRMRAFAAREFFVYLDPRLLALYIEMLDDATAYTEKHAMSENTSRPTSTIRRDARGRILWALNKVLDMNVDEAPFEIADEAAGCVALKTWLTDNWAQVVAKCAETKADPTWIGALPESISNFDVRY